MSTPTDHRTTTRRPPHRRSDEARRAAARRLERERATAPRRERTAGAPRSRVRRLAAEQLAVAAGQLGAGAGNLVFALVAARLLAPGAFAELAAFLALYLLIHVPAGSLSAGSAAAPGLAARAQRRVLAAGGAVGVALAVLAVPLGALLDLSPVMLLAAAAAAPTAGLLALDRGRLYGLGRHRRIVGSLLAEPAVRLTLGVALAAIVGPAGGAVAVVLAGWAALAVARLPAVARRPERAARARPGAAVAAFLLLAVVQSQDVLLANALLPAGEAGRFAVISTLGGAAAFATTTVPLMLLARPAGAGREALRVALAVAAGLGLAAVAVVAVSPERLVSGVFGERYAGAGAAAVPYMLAMALLGVARVLVAHAAAAGAGRRAVALLAVIAGLHIALIVALGDDATGVATATLAATALLTAGAAALARGDVRRAARGDVGRAARGDAGRASGAATPRAPGLGAPAIRGGAIAALVRGAAVRLPAPATWPARAAALLRRRDVAAVCGLAAAGLLVRVLATRGIWLDEATSIHQAQLSLGGLFESLRTTDVHPPLHHVVLWGTVRVLGVSELSVRLPSLLAATALIPLVYLAGREIYDRRAGLAAAALATVAPFSVWYAQEARMYALFMVFAVLAVWMQVRILRGEGGTKSRLAYVLASAALIYTQYFGILFVGVQQLTFLVALRVRRGGRLEWLAWTGLLALLVAPLVPFGLDQFAANEAAGKGFQQVPSQAGGAVGGVGATPGAYAAITNGVWAVLGYHSDQTMTAIAALWPLAVLLALALLGRGRSWPTLLVVACAAVPALALFVLGQAKPFVFEVRYFVGAVPLALLLIARALTTWARRPGVVTALCAAAVAVLSLGLADQQLNGSNPRIYDFRGAIADIEKRSRPGDVIVFTPPYLDHVVGFYEDGGLRTAPLANGLPEPRRGRRVFVLASFLDKPQFRAQTQRAVRRLSRDHELVRRDERPQIRTWEFRR